MRQCGHRTLFAKLSANSSTLLNRRPRGGGDPGLMPLSLAPPGSPPSRGRRIYLYRLLNARQYLDIDLLARNIVRNMLVIGEHQAQLVLARRQVQHRLGFTLAEVLVVLV